MISRPARISLSLLLSIFVVRPPTAGQTISPEVALSGSLSARAIRADELLQFTLTVKNKADAKTGANAVVRNVTLQELPVGYVLAPDKEICSLPLIPPRTKSCQTASEFNGTNSLAVSLEPGQGITVQGFLKPSSTHKAATLNAVVAWTTNGGASSLAVSLGENQVQETYQVIETWSSDLVKLLAIPIALALIGWGLNWLNRAHDERQHKHEVEQAVRSETWKQMLLVSHNYAAKCYLPLSLAATRLAINLRALAAAQGDARIAFYYVLLCGREMGHTRKRTGGLYFKDLRGELLAAECWRLQRAALISSNEEDAFNLAIRYAVDLISGIETYAAFKRKFEVAGSATVAFNHPDIQNAWSLFNQWRTKQPNSVTTVAEYIEGFFAILDYEANRPYQYWYDTKPILVVSKETEKLLREILSKQYVPERVNEYFANVVRP